MATKKPSQLAVTLFNVRDFCNSADEIAKTLDRVRRIGYENVQISGRGLMEQPPEDLGRMIRDAGLRAIGSHVSLTLMRTDFAGVVARLKAWQCPYVAIPWMPAEECNTLEAWKTRAKEFNGYGKAFAREGLRLQYHNHHFEFAKVGGKNGLGGRTGLGVLYALTDRKFLQAEIDVGWVARGGGDPAAWMRSVKGRADQVHVKDWMILNNEPAWAEIGEGNLNWPAVLAACKASGVKTYIVEQDACPVTKDPFRSIEISFKNLRKMGLK